MITRSGRWVANVKSALFAPLSRALVAIAAAALPMLLMASAFAQTPPPKPALGVQEQGMPAQPAAAPQAQPAPQPSLPEPENPGLINEMGKFFDNILPPLKSPGETIDNLNTRAKDAGDALSRIAKPGSMVSGRTTCPVAANGTPDCKLGADKLCQSKGFKEGKSLNTNSVEACSPKVLIPGRQRKPDDCRTDNYVTTALCQ